MKLTYCIPTWNEASELKILLKILIDNIDFNDTILIQGHQGKITDDVIRVIRAVMSDPRIKYIEYPLNDNFGQYKNNLILQSDHDTDYCFFIDADEVIPPVLLQSIKTIIEENKDLDDNYIDAFIVPRLNIVHDITPEYIQKSGWVSTQIDITGNLILKNIYCIADDIITCINPFDPQWRIFKRNNSIRYEGNVHERLIGFRTFGQLPNQFDYMIHHVKSFDRQQKQNNLYDRL